MKPAGRALIVGAGVTILEIAGDASGRPRRELVS
jgi:hypothetical protein